MQHLDLILTITGGLAAALALGYLTYRLGLSPIVGYLLAGIVVGPNTPGFVANHALAEQLAEIGVILLMFGVGLHFHVQDLLAVRRVAVPGAIGQAIVSTALGMAVAWVYGWPWQAALVFGLTLSVASTVVLTRVLAENNDLHTPGGHVAVGWLVVQDLFAVLVLVLLEAIFGKEKPGGPLAMTIGLAALKVVLLVGCVFLLGGRLIPWLLRHVAATHSRELFTLTVLVVALGIAVGSSLLFGVSMALGAFLAGMVVGRSDFSVRAATEALPMRDAFAVLFFVSVGMLFDPASLLKAPGLAAATLAVVLLGTPLAALGLVLARGYPIRLAVTVGLSLSQIGEFSFILAVEGRTLGILSEDAVHAVVAAAIVSISLNPVVYRLADPVALWIERRPRAHRLLAAFARRPPAAAAAHKPAPPLADPQHRAVIVGYGPVGQTLARLLRENEIEPTVIELNLDAVTRLRAEGKPAVYGDANHPDTLRQAGLDRAGTLILSASEFRGGEEVIRAAKEINPDVRILARAAYLRERPALRKAGADMVFAGEGEVALAMTESVLRALGATAEQVDRERDRVRADLFGGGSGARSEPVPAGPSADSHAAAKGDGEAGASATESKTEGNGTRISAD